MFSDYFLPHVGGGVERVVYEISKALVEAGDRVSVVTLNTRNATEYESIEGISVYRAHALGLTNVAGMQSTVSLNSISLALDVCHKFKPDILHAHNIFFSTTAVSTLLRTILRIPLVLTLHLGAFDMLGRKERLLASSYERLVGRWEANVADRVTAVSMAVQAHGAGALGISLQDISLIPNGVDSGRFSPPQDFREPKHGPAKLSVAFVGRMIENKGIEYLVKAAPKVLTRFNARFVVVGNGPMYDQVQRLTRSLGVANSFEFLGEVDHVEDILRSCDMLVRPSLTDGMPLGVLEAMSCGIPVIATSVAGTPELVRDRGTGLLIPPRDSEALARAIVELAQNPSLARELAWNARLFVERCKDWRDIAALYRNVYVNLLDRRIT